MKNFKNVIALSILSFATGLLSIQLGAQVLTTPPGLPPPTPRPLKVTAKADQTYNGQTTSLAGYIKIRCSKVDPTGMASAIIYFDDDGTSSGSVVFNVKGECDLTYELYSNVFDMEGSSGGGNGMEGRAYHLLLRGKKHVAETDQTVDLKVNVPFRDIKVTVFAYKLSAANPISGVGADVTLFFPSENFRRIKRRKNNPISNAEGKFIVGFDQVPVIKITNDDNNLCSISADSIGRFDWKARPGWTEVTGWSTIGRPENGDTTVSLKIKLAPGN